MRISLIFSTLIICQQNKKIFEYYEKFWNVFLIFALRLRKDKNHKTKRFLMDLSSCFSRLSSSGTFLKETVNKYFKWITRILFVWYLLAFHEPLSRNKIRSNELFTIIKDKKIVTIRLKGQSRKCPLILLNFLLVKHC